MTLKDGYGKFSLFVTLADGRKDQKMDSSFSEENPNIEKALFD